MMGAGKPVPIVSVSTYPDRMSLKQTDIHVIVRMAESPDNRKLVVTVDGTNYYRSTEEEWTDERWLSPRIKKITFKDLVEGEYVITAAVTRADGKTHTAHTTFCVMGPETECGLNTHADLQAIPQ